jgi:protein TonB
MDRSLILPLSLAAALHAGVLFGFNRGPVPTPLVAPAKPMLPGCTFDLVEPPDPIVAPDCGGDIKPMTALPTRRGIDYSIPDPRSDWPVGTKLPPLNIGGTAIGPVSIVLPTGIGEGEGGLIIDPAKLDKSPRTRLQIPPAYPFEAKARGQSGRVVIEFVVDERGRVLDPHIVSSSDRMFEEPTLRAVSKWRFEPGRKDGRVVRFRMALPVEFNLDGN